MLSRCFHFGVFEIFVATMKRQDNKKHYVAPMVSAHHIESAHLMAAVSGEENGKSQTEKLNVEEYQWD